MVDIIIPTFRARGTLPAALDSLVAQTKKMFIVTVVQDCDGEDYSDIIEEYKRRGLKVRLIQTEKNGGPGAARQRGMDSDKMSEFFMFMDADDILNPRAVEILSREIKLHNADLATSDFLVNEKADIPTYMSVDNTPCTWCFVAGTPVLTEKGYRPIEELKIGDLVYTHDGTLQPITNVMTHVADNVVSTKVSGALSLTTTKNHKFFIRQGCSLTKKPLEEIEHTDEVVLFKLPSNRKKSIDPNLAYIIGRYVGDGWKTSKKVQLKNGKKEYWSYFLCSSSEEKDYLVEKLQKANIEFGFHNNNDRGDIQEYTLYMKNKDLIKYLSDCGRYAIDKHFPTEFLEWDDETISAMLQGYFEADGCTIERGAKKVNKTNTISRRLALETSLILRTLGKTPTYTISYLNGKEQIVMGKKCKRHNEYQVQWYTEENCAKYVKQNKEFCTTYGMSYTEEKEQLVYNITVENNHSYIAGDFIVSNCHGKIYRAQYLRDKNIRFFPGLRLNEDSYFNLVATNCTKKRIKIREVTYIWNQQNNSLTHKDGIIGFHVKSWEQYIFSQVQGLLDIVDRNGEVDPALVAATLINVYTHHMKALCGNVAPLCKVEDFRSAAEELKRLTRSPEVSSALKSKEFWNYICENLKASEMFDGNLVFYKMRFCDWLKEYLWEEIR